MLIFRLFNFIRGYVIIKLENSNYEKTLNLLRRKGISLWDVEKKENGIKFKISYEDYNKYLNLMKEKELEPVKTTGLVLKISKIKFRKGFIVGILILLFSFAMLTTLVWDIQIDGVDEVLSREIVVVLKENGIKTPSSKKLLDKKRIETLVYKNFDNFKFVEAYLEGSKLIIFVKEKESENAILKENTPSSIISTKNAVINKVIAKSGQAVVKEGDVVYEGQTLVMGIMKNKNSEEFFMVPSDGTVYGKTYYSFALKEPKVKNIEVSTNNSKSVYYLQNNDKKIKIIGDTEPYKNYNYKEKTIWIPVLSNLTNITLSKGIYYEYNYNEVELDENSAKNKLKISMYDSLIDMCSKDSKVLNSSLKYSEDDTYFYLNAQIEVIEDIGKKVKIYPTETQEEKNEEQ